MVQATFEVTEEEWKVEATQEGEAIEEVPPLITYKHQTKCPNFESLYSQINSEPIKTAIETIRLEMKDILIKGAILISGTGKLIYSDGAILEIAQEVFGEIIQNEASFVKRQNFNLRRPKNKLLANYDITANRIKSIFENGRYRVLSEPVLSILNLLREEKDLSAQSSFLIVPENYFTRTRNLQDNTKRVLTKFIKTRLEEILGYNPQNEKGISLESKIVDLFWQEDIRPLRAEFKRNTEQ